MFSDKHRKSGSETDSDRWQQETITKLAFAAVDEQRRARRWSIFFKFLFFSYLVAIIFLYKPELSIRQGELDRHTALVEMKGIIAPDKEAGADNIVSGLRSAFESKNTAGVILRINSPGGSPVQAGYINDEIQRLRKEYSEIPFYVVIADVCASGGYYVAAAADKIYADKASIVGSIGVRMDSFGFVDAMEKLGIERRLLTAGEHKGFLDPFLPTKERDVQQVETLLKDIHQQFIDVVKDGRGDKLQDEPNLFSGYVWTGEQAVDLGLVDELGSASYVAREVIGEENIVDYTPQEDLFEKFSRKLGTVLAQQLGQMFAGESVMLR